MTEGSGRARRLTRARGPKPEPKGEVVRQSAIDPHGPTARQPRRLIGRPLPFRPELVLCPSPEPGANGRQTSIFDEDGTRVRMNF
jgi:hypothetical protein